MEKNWSNHPFMVLGSCLSYGHSCWGAHGKRSGNAAGMGMGGPDTQWFISRLAPRQLEAKLFPKPADTIEDQKRTPAVMGEASLILPADPDMGEDVLGADDKQVIIMEEPPRLYKILNHLPSKLERK